MIVQWVEGLAGWTGHEWEWVGVVHNIHDSNFMQELKALKIQKEKTGDEDGQKDVEQQIQLKSTETDLAYSKAVRLWNITLQQMLYAIWSVPW